jgi:hypothetical protein
MFILEEDIVKGIIFIVNVHKKAAGPWLGLELLGSKNFRRTSPKPKGRYSMKVFIHALSMSTHVSDEQVGLIQVLVYKVLASGLPTNHC